MTPFLEQQASRILALVAEEPDYEHIVVLPNRRSCQFTNRYLTQNARQIGFKGILPQVTTFDSLAGNITGLQVADDILLSYILYKHFRNNTLNNEDFVKFANWCGILLDDFNEIHLELINYKLLFINAADDAEVQLRFADFLTEEEKEIILKLWKDFDQGTRSQYLTRFIELWQTLPTLLTAFDDELIAEGLAYPGLIMRKANEQASDYMKANPVAKHHFVGFHTLPKSYAALMEHLLANGQATVAWDTNSALFQQPETKAFHEGNTYIKRIRPFRMLYGTLHTHLTTTEEPQCQHITLVKATSTNTSIRSLPGILQNLAANQGANWYEDVLICLCKPELLEPMLSKLLKQSQIPINISIGINLSSTALKPLVAQLRQIHTLHLKNPEADQVHLPTFLAFLENPYIRGAANTDINAYRFANSGPATLYTTSSKLAAALPNLATVITSLYGPGTANQKLNRVLGFLLQAFQSQADETQSLRHLTIKKAFAELNKLESLNAYRQSLQIDDIFDLFESSLGQYKIQFAGEPLVGLQVVGLIETRNLDYKHIILVGANEGTLPPSRIKPSFIPASLRRAFKLPTVEDETGLYSYLFFRLFSRSQSIHILYDEASGETSQGEKSRFLTQLQYESTIPVVYTTVAQSALLHTQHHPISVEKTPEIMAFLRRYLASAPRDIAKQLYPSGILTYLECPLRFYFRFVVGIDKDDDLTGEVDARVFGNIIHFTLDIAYAQLKQNVGERLVTPEDLEVLTQNLDAYITRATAVAMGQEQNATLQDSNMVLIATRVAKRFVLNVIEFDKAQPFRLIAIEAKAGQTLQMPVIIDGGIDYVQVQGKIDRIDSVDDTIRIIDYKTGKAEHQLPSIDKLFTDKKINKEALQILFYAWLYQQSLPDHPPVKPVVFGIRKANAVKNDSDHLTYYLKDSAEYIEDIAPFAPALEAGYAKVLQSLFDRNIPFTQTEHIDRCTHCSYTSICKR